MVSCTKPTLKDATPPNIIFILVDDLGKEWVSCYGAEDIETKNIDALASSGAMFNNVYSMPQCTPSRVTLLTGQYPYRHGWVNHWDVPRWGGGAHFDESLYPSLGREMKKAGYATAIAGKWQIDDFRVEPDALTKNGFDEYCMWTGYETGIDASKERYQNPYIFTKDGSSTYVGEFGPDIFKDFIIRFIKKKRDAPFFVYYPMVLTHPPLVNTPDGSATTDMGKHKVMVKYTDKITGEIVKALEEQNLRENTVIIWATDNGTSHGIEGIFGGRKIMGAKSKTTEPGICAPFIVSWPQHIPPNSESDALIDFTDMLPTFLDLAGVEEMPPNSIDGKSFKETLLDISKASQRKWILGMGGGNNARLTNKGVENQYVFRDRVLRNQQFKLYVGADRKPDKFFDLQNDPDENMNLINELNTDEQKENFALLTKAIPTFPSQDSDPKYIPNPPQAWDVKVSAESQTWKKSK